MDLLGQWRRRIFGAAAGVIIAPIAIVGAALAVGFGGGGIAGLGALGQAFDGPRLPDVAPLPRSGDTRDTGRLLARLRRDSAAPSGTTVAAVPTDPATNGDKTPSDSTTTSGGSFDPGGGTPPPTEAATTVPPPAATTAPAEPSPSAVRQVGDTVKTVTDQVPVVGAPAGQVVDTLVDTVDSVLRPR